MSVPLPGSTSGRHRRPHNSSPHLVRWTAQAAVGAMVLAGCGVALAVGRQTQIPCPDGVRSLRVAVTPELAGIVAEVARTVDGAPGGCTRTHVRPVSATEVAASLRRTTASSTGVDVPEVWIPDSSAWLRPSAVGGRVRLAGPAPSVAVSPIVLAVARETAASLGWHSPLVDLGPLLQRDPAGRPADIYLADPRGSATAAGALLSLRATATTRPDGPAALTAALLGHVGGAAGSTPGPFTELGGAGADAVPASEQQVWAYDRSAASARQVVAAYPTRHGTSLDYPFVVLARARTAQEDAVRLLSALIGEHGRERLLAGGFRDRSGTGGSVLTSRFGVDGAVAAGPAPRGDDVDRALSGFRVLSQGSRMLAVIDVSGSMGERVPGTGGATRLDLTKQAAVRGLGVYPDDTRIGLWAFATNLTPRADYRELVPIGPLGGSSAGSTGRQQLASHLAALHHVPGGGTGLYDTALAATRRVRAQWEPGRVNSVVLLTDGRNDDDHGIALSELLTRLRAENDPARPVPLITIAYGAQSPVDALRAMSSATGGATYLAEDPRQVGKVFLEAIQQRACRPTCAP